MVGRGGNSRNWLSPLFMLIHYSMAKGNSFREIISTESTGPDQDGDSPGEHAMMYIDNEVLEKMIMTMVEGFNRLEKKLDRMNRLKDCLDGDTLLDNCDLAQLLGVTQRTIARYREKGLIRYYQTDENGKNFYRSSEIQDFLRHRGKKK